MFNRRSMLKRLGAVVAIVALAPEIAFNRSINFPKVDDPFWTQMMKGYLAS